MAKDKILNLWQLPSEWDLVTDVANFYSLYNLFIQGRDDGRFALLVSRILPLVQNYTDMVIGGELRHVVSKCGKDPILVESLSTLRQTLRNDAWVKWWAIRKQYGLEALELAVKAFKKGKNNLGGPRWATITRVLLAMLRGEISKTMFLDTCFCMQHNGGQYFSKLSGWYGWKVRPVLDLNLAGDMEGVLRYASRDVREFVQGAGGV